MHVVPPRLHIPYNHKIDLALGILISVLPILVSANIAETEEALG